VEVADPVLAKAVRESISPEASMAPAEVVACPTPRPPEVPPAEVAPMKRLPPLEMAWAGEVVPTPRFPVSMNLPASVSRPDLRVEKIKSAFPVKKFWVRREVKAEVVVADPVWSRVLKESLEAVVVAEERLAMVIGVAVAAAIEEVAVKVPKVGEVVADKVKV